MKKITIVGAGFSGMSLAYFLNLKGCAVTLIDQKDRVGGMISTGQVASGTYETAANGFLNTATVEKFLRDIQADYIGSSVTAKKRYIFRDRPRRWPLTLLESFNFFTKLMLFLSRKKVNRLASPRESIQDWCDKNLTTASADYLVAPALQGIYAGDLERLSASLVLNPMLTSRREKTTISSSLLSGKMGMQDLMSKLEEHLRQQGVQFQLSTLWLPEMQTDHLVIATSAPEAQKILAQIGSIEAKANSQVLKKIEMNSLVTATCFYSQTPKAYKGFGILFPRLEKVRALGVLMNNMIFQRAATAHSETWIYGGALDRDFVFLTDEQIKNFILLDREKVFPKSGEPSEIKITRWPAALPHYTVDHEKFLAQLVPMKAISLHGNYLGGIGLSRILEQSEKLAQKINLEVT